jgi:regulator of sigma E protease
MKVHPANLHDQNEPKARPAMRWDSSWRFDQEVPLSKAAPLAIPELGIAYHVENIVEGVESGSPAARAKLQPGDQIEQLRFRQRGKTVDEEKWSRDWLTLASADSKDPDAYEWPYCFWAVQEQDYHEIEVKVRRGSDLRPEVRLTAEADPGWPLAQRGWLLLSDLRLQKADTLLEALGMGVNRTVGFIKQMYLSLSSIFNGRVSAKRAVGGPIEIFAQGFSAAEDPFVLILFLGIISINLAVVNFLPIPVLDGGHMVFLVYEKLRGQPPSDSVRAVATYVGLAVLGVLMVCVFWVDIQRHWPW